MNKEAKKPNEKDNIELIDDLLTDLTISEVLDLLWSKDADQVANWIEEKEYVFKDDTYEYLTENWR